MKDLLGLSGLLVQSHMNRFLICFTTLPKKTLKSVRLYNNVEIDDNKTYIVALVDFLINCKGGDDFVDVLTWYTPRNIKKFGFVRDVMKNYLRKLGTIKDNIIDKKNPRISIDNNCNPKFLE